MKKKKVTKKKSIKKNKYIIIIRGFDQIFQFDTKKNALGFSKDITKKYPDIEWAISKVCL